MKHNSNAGARFLRPLERLRLVALAVRWTRKLLERRIRAEAGFLFVAYKTNKIKYQQL